MHKDENLLLLIWPRLLVALIAGGLLGFGIAVYLRRDRLEVIEPEAISWNGHLLALPTNGKLVSWPDLTPFYSVRLADSSGNESGVPVSTIYYVVDEFAQLTEWPKRSFARASRNSVPMAPNSAGGARELHCFREFVPYRDEKREMFRLLVTVDGYADSIGYIGSERHLKDYLARTAAALEALQVASEPVCLLRRCLLDEAKLSLPDDCNGRHGNSDAVVTCPVIFGPIES